MGAKLALWLALLAVPAHYRVRLETTKGAIVIAVDRARAPRGADRFHQLVTSGYYDDSRFFRVVKGKWAQFGINGDPAISKRWRKAPIADEEQAQASNVRGTFAFAFAQPGGRATQLFINLRDNPALDSQGFIPIGRVVEGMEVADALYSGYGETSGGGIRGGKQEPLFEGGNGYLDKAFPLLDKLICAKVIER